jgi:hypothetical protein
VLIIPPAMTRRVDQERSILGTELEEPKLVARGVCRKRDPRSAVEAQGNLARLAPGGLKKVEAAGWVRWKGARKQLPKSPFSASFHRYIDTCGSFPGKSASWCC